jgi:hypothetical protein
MRPVRSVEAFRMQSRKMAGHLNRQNACAGFSAFARRREVRLQMPFAPTA